MVEPVLPIVAACKIVPFNVPLRVNPVNVPTEVMLLWVALVTNEAVPELTMLVKLYPLPVNDAPTLPIVAACMVVPFNVPLRVRPVNVPRLVILLWVASIT